jgi:hypothetical protein
MKKPNLSQSVMKDYQEFWNMKTLSCGLYLFKRNYQRIPVEQGDAAKLGTYFEYLCTGYVRPNDEPPQPEMVYKGTAREKVAADYERAIKSAEFFKNVIEHYGIKILTAGEYLITDGASAILDLRAEWGGKECIIDIKYSGLIDDKFSPYGWATESLVDRPGLTIQALHYKYILSRLEGKENIDFYYFVFSTKDVNNAKIIRINVDESALYRHEMDVAKIKKIIDYHYEKAEEYATDMKVSMDFSPHELVARPTLSRCLDCPYFDTCDKRAEVPKVEEIQIY